ETIAAPRHVGAERQFRPRRIPLLEMLSVVVSEGAAAEQQEVGLISSQPFLAIENDRVVADDAVAAANDHSNGIVIRDRAAVDGTVRRIAAQGGRAQRSRIVTAGVMNDP